MQSLHNLKVLTCAQRKKLSTQATSDNGNATDTTAASTDATSDFNYDCNPVHAWSSAPLVETVEDDDSCLDSPSMPDLRIYHPLSDSDSDHCDSAFQPSTHVSLNASQAFAPSLR